MSSQPPTIAETLARLEQALPVGDFDYDDGYRDALHSVLLALAQAGMSRQALDDAITTALDAHANNAAQVAREKPGDQQLTADGHPLPSLRFVPPLEALTDEQRDIDTDKARDAMTLEYEAWMKLEGLDLTSADEHLFDPKLTLAQLEWVREFTERWDHNDQIESLQHEQKRSP
ncbi:hypothetical protein LJR168_003778 [Pseudoxanthomonas sp. LjRoot168]|uniref:hypothetical protein n=1 Tax=unclassified Pseudoxanthomonas TaxID=2645906 RepID=UPI003ED04881